MQRLYTLTLRLLVYNIKWNRVGKFFQQFSIPKKINRKEKKNCLDPWKWSLEHSRRLGSKARMLSINNWWIQSQIWTKQLQIWQKLFSYKVSPLLTMKIDWKHKQMGIIMRIIRKVSWKTKVKVKTKNKMRKITLKILRIKK